MSTSPLSSPSDARAQRTGKGEPMVIIGAPAAAAAMGPPALPASQRPNAQSTASGWALPAQRPPSRKRKLSLSPESSPALGAADDEAFNPDDFPPALVGEGEEPVAHLYTSQGRRQQRLAIQPHVPFSVGRHPFCDYVLDTPSASRRHFKLLAHITDSGDAFVSLVDQSTNGILLNGRRVDSRSACLLCDGDRIGMPGLAQKFLYRHASAAREEAEQEVGEYRVLPRVLGTGTYASVRLAIHVPTGAQAACKRQNRAWLADAQTAKNAAREVALLKKMKHVSGMRWCGICGADLTEHQPNINSFLAIEQDEEHVYYFVSCVTGGDLFNYVAAHRQLADPEAKFIFYQLRLAIAYLHDRGIAHRDIKPENVLLLAAGRYPHIQLGDFGLASDAPAQLQRAHSQCGTVSYLPPEALRCRVTQESYDALALDTWGLGAVLYIMLCGTHPFDHCQLDTLDDVAFEVQAELLQRRLVSYEWLRSRALLVPTPPAPAALADAREAHAAAESRRQLVQNVFAGVAFDVDLPKMPCLAARFLLQQLLATDARMRITAKAAGQAEWLRHSRRELEIMYKQRVGGLL